MYGHFVWIKSSERVVLCEMDFSIGMREMGDGFGYGSL